MPLPSIPGEFSGGGQRSASTVGGRHSAERAVIAMTIVVVLEGSQLSIKIDRIPEECAVQILAPNGPNQALNEGM
jgi:hypothetical protein